MEYSGFFDGVEYTSSAYSFFYELVSVAIGHGYLNELKVSAGSGLQIKLDSGGMTSRGRYYVQDEAVDGSAPFLFSIDAAAVGKVRKDRLVIEFDSGTGGATAKIKKGTEVSNNPSAPTFENTETKWDEPLAIINVSEGTITSIEDERVIKGARVNPDFDEDISAPNMTTGVLTASLVIGNNLNVKDGGKIYINTTKTSYIRYDATTEKVFLKVFGCEEVQLAPVTYGTGDAPTTGTYPAGTIYLKHET